jgi:hypothetical protein
MVPRKVRYIEKMPLLGTGKIDIPAVQRLVSAHDKTREVALAD